MRTDGDEGRQVLWVSLGATVIVALLWIGWWYYAEHRFNSSGHLAAFGSLFGGVSALFSGLAFAGLVVAIFYQQRELRETRRAFVANVVSQETISRNSTRESILSVLKIYIELLSSTRVRGIMDGVSELGEWKFPADDRHIFNYKQIRRCIPHIEIAMDAISWVDREVIDLQDRLTCLLQLEYSISAAANELFESLDPNEKWEQWLQAKYASDEVRWKEYDPLVHVPEIREKFARWKKIVFPLKDHIRALRSKIDG